MQNYANAMPSFQGQLKERQVLALVLMMKYLDRLVDDNGNRLETPNLDGIGTDDGTGQEKTPMSAPTGEVAKETVIQVDAVKGG